MKGLKSETGGVPLRYQNLLKHGQSDAQCKLGACRNAGRKFVRRAVARWRKERPNPIQLPLSLKTCAIIPVGNFSQFAKGTFRGFSCHSDSKEGSPSSFLAVGHSGIVCPWKPRGRESTVTQKC
jgi:hypothetical protein